MEIPPLRVGLFGIGLEAYWPQFEGLKERLSRNLDWVAARLARPGIEVTQAGLVDSVEKALEAGHAFRRADIDFLLLYVTTYALSATVWPVVRLAKVPLLVLNLQPAPSIAYERFNRLRDRTVMTGEWLAHCNACPLPEIANVLGRARLPFFQATGVLDEADGVWDEVNEWLEAARVAAALGHIRLGVMGHYYNGMLDISTDLTALSIAFGTHPEMIEVEELAAERERIEKAPIEERVARFRETFEVEDDCSLEELKRAARTALALDQMVQRHQLGALAYYHKGSGVTTCEDTMSSIILGASELTARGIPVAGEMELKNVHAMKILDLMGVGGSFTEYYAMDFPDEVVLMGHDGPGHIAIAQGKTKVRPLGVYHGKVGQGLSVEMAVRHGPVTLLAIAEAPGGGWKMVVAEGQSVPGPILEIGNTNSRYRFPGGVRRFTEAWNAQGPAHHCAVGIGHRASILKKTGQLLNMPVVQIS